MRENFAAREIEVRTALQQAEEREAGLREAVRTLPAIMAGSIIQGPGDRQEQETWQAGWRSCVENLRLRVDEITSATYRACVCHNGSICGEACHSGVHHVGCPHIAFTPPAKEPAPDRKLHNFLWVKKDTYVCQNRECGKRITDRGGEEREQDEGYCVAPAPKAEEAK